MKGSALHLSDRKRLVSESPIRKLVPYADAAREAGRTVFHLNIGQPDIRTIPAMREAYSQAPEVIGYGPSQGLPELRAGFTEYYAGNGIQVSKDQVFITNGGSEAIVFALMAITSPGDEIIIPEPYYANYNGFAAMVGVKVVPVTTSIHEGFHLPDAADFEKKIGPRTRAIMFSNPGNPTGAVFSREKLRDLVELAESHSLFLISDEVYREFTYGEKRAVSILEFEGFDDNLIMVDSVSKRYSACGARIGTIVSRNEEFLDLVLRFAQARLCPPTVDQTAVLAALNAPEEYLQEVRQEYKERRDYLYRQLTGIPGVEVSFPEGAFYLIAQLPVDDAEDFAIWLLRDFHIDGETVMVAPAQGFYASPGLGRNQIRLAYVLTVEKLERAIRILRKGLQTYRAVSGLDQDLQRRVV
ncbi:MAG: pyridoxal phosphate-dependent aminotransferase [Spirochaetota bacterium]|nr:pyridoxal phosphate-dependent aminotransferase [Spirochaetota bacterium]